MALSQLMHLVCLSIANNRQPRDQLSAYANEPVRFCVLPVPAEARMEFGRAALRCREVIFDETITAVEHSYGRRGEGG